MNIEPVTYMSSSPGFSTEKAKVDHVHQTTPLPRFLYKSKTVQTLTHGVTVVSAFPIKMYDIDNLVTSNTTFTASITGNWDLYYAIYRSNIAVAVTTVVVEPYLCVNNDATNGRYAWNSSYVTSGPGLNAAAVSGSACLYLTKGDTVKVYMVQANSSSFNIDIHNATYPSLFGGSFKGI